MNIIDLLIQPPVSETNLSQGSTSPIHDDSLMAVWESVLDQYGFRLRPTSERNTLTDAILTHTTPSIFHDMPVHIKVIGRHMNGSFRCHIGTGKASRAIRSTELCRQMRLLAVFFRAENSKSQLVSPDFIFFPTWLLHLFRYTQHGSTPGRTDVRFLENAAFAKEDHIYRLNHVLNTLFRFNLHAFDGQKLNKAVELANYLFTTAGLDPHHLPRPQFSNALPPTHPTQPTLYATLILLLHTPRPSKLKPFCHNCNTKPASRRKLCVACYRYQLKHGEARPLRLIVANRPGSRPSEEEPYDHQNSVSGLCHVPRTLITSPTRSQKKCANCGVHETHQWYRNLCGTGHWCETCKSYYLRHTKIRPAELFVKAAKRKVDVRTLVNWSSWSGQEEEKQEQGVHPPSLAHSFVHSAWAPSFAHPPPTETRRASDASLSSSSITSTHPSSSSPQTPSGCRPHLYHARYSYGPPPSVHGSSSSSPDVGLLGSPTTPPCTVPYFFSHPKPHRFSAPATTTYDSSYNAYCPPWTIE